MTTEQKYWELFLDDIRNPPNGSNADIVICRSSREAVTKCREAECLPNLIMFDYHLVDADNACNFIDWMNMQLLRGVYKLPKPFNYSTHSSSKDGRAIIHKRMSKIIQNFSQGD